MSSGSSKCPERAAFVRKQREERAWTQEQLAIVADVTLRTIQRVEQNGAASPETLMAVAGAFEMEVKQLSAAALKARAFDPPRVHLLPRLIFGRDLSYLVGGGDQFQVEHDDDEDPRSVGAMKGVVQEIKRDIVRLVDANPTERLSIEDDLSKDLEGMANLGYYIFGIRRVIPGFANGQSSLVMMVTLYVSHSRSPKLVKDKEKMVIPALLAEVARRAEPLST